jgi:hypothetical protein
MSVNVTEHFVQQYSTNLDLLLQQRGSKLRDLVTVGSDHTGKQASPVDQIGAIEAQTPEARFAPIVPVHADMTRRWVYPIDKDVPQYLDRFDMLRLLNDPKGKYVENAAHAIGRAYDDEIIDKALATANTGETGASTENFDTTNYSVAADYEASGDVGMTIDKLLEVRRMFRSAEVDLEMESITLVIGERQERDLLGQVEVVSTDYNDHPVLVDGNLKRFLGFFIVVTTRLDVINTDQRVCFAFAKSGLYLGIWKDMETTITHREDLSGRPWQVYTCATFGATRIEQGKVIRILADEG